MSSILSKLLAKDANWKRFLNILEASERLSDFDNYANEVLNIHKGRKSRQLVYKASSAKRLIEANMQDISFRSRCVEIMIEVRRARRLLNISLDSIKNHILATYQTYLSAYRTKAERDIYVSSLVSDAEAKLAEFESIIEVCELVVSDIDKTSWSMKSILDAMELIYRRENVLGTQVKTV